MMLTRGPLVSLLLICALSASIKFTLAVEKLAPDVFEKLMGDIEQLRMQDDGTKDVTQLSGFKVGLAAYETMKKVMKFNKLTADQEVAYFKLKTGKRPNLVDKLDEQLKISTIVQLAVFDNNRSKWCQCAPDCNPADFERLIEAYKYLVDAKKGPYLSRVMAAKFDNSFQLYEQCKGLEALNELI